MTLRVTLEIVPFGDEDKKYEIGRLDIGNSGPIGFGHCEYVVIDMTDEEWGMYQDRVMHRRDLGAWALVAKAIHRLDITGPGIKSNERTNSSTPPP